MQISSIEFDSNGIISFIYNGEKCYNPFEISLQAMLGEMVIAEYEGVTGMLVPRYYPLESLPNVTNEESARVAIKWLLEHSDDDGENLFAVYNYDAEYAGIKMKAPWRSAFGQAYFILALLYWGKWTGKKEYFRKAEKAAKGLVLPLNQGGCSTTINGEFWFEEIPQNSSHIFNAHLISIVALMELMKMLDCEWPKKYVDSGVKVFIDNIYKMDSGISSLYDMPEFYDGHLQLIPNDPAHKICLKEITVIDADAKRKINLSDISCFNSAQSIWISGIDWSSEDEEGYRTLLPGIIRHAEDVPGGVRQNTFLQLRKISSKKDIFKLGFQYKCDCDSNLSINRVDGRGGYRELGYNQTVYCKAGKGYAEITLPVTVLVAPIHKKYHEFHIFLLETIYEKVKSQALAGLIKKFRHYDDIAWIQNNPKKDETILESISVTVNSRGGLFCKMCDIGIENEKASPFKKLRANEEEINSDILINRCREARPELKKVHFVGTEVTLYKSFPNVVRQLRSLGIDVYATTNGINLENMLTDLLNTGINSLYISIDGPSVIHDKLRGKIGLFNKIVNTLISNRSKIEAAKRDNDFCLGISCAITPMNYEALPELVQIISELPVDSLDCTHLNYVLPSVAQKHNKENPDYKIGESHPEMNPAKINPFLMMKALQDAKLIANKKNVNFTCVPRLESYLRIEDFYKRPDICVVSRKCCVANRHLQIGADGEVCVMSRCYQFKIGNIYDNTFEDLFYSRAIMDFRNFIDKGFYLPCFHCCGAME